MNLSQRIGGLLVTGLLTAAAVSPTAFAQTKPSVDLTGTYRIMGPGGGPGGRGGGRGPGGPGGRGGGRGPQTVEQKMFKVNGQPVPLRPEAEKLYRERLEAGMKGEVFRDTVSRCLPPGMPQAVLLVPYLVQVLQTPGQITVLYEEQNEFRIIRMDKEHPKELDESFFGDSVGKWDGDTLVVDTIGIRDDSTIDKAGLPQSTAMHVTERIRRVDATTLEDSVTIDDPKIFTKSWDAKSTWRKPNAGEHMTENVCENRRFFQ